MHAATVLLLVLSIHPCFAQLNFQPRVGFSTGYVDMLTRLPGLELNSNEAIGDRTTTKAVRIMGHFGYEVQVWEREKVRLSLLTTFGLGRRQALNSNKFVNATVSELHPQVVAQFEQLGILWQAFVGRAISLSSDAPSTNRIGVGVYQKSGNSIALFCTLPARKERATSASGDTYLASRYMDAGVRYLIALR